MIHWCDEVRVVDEREESRIPQVDGSWDNVSQMQNRINRLQKQMNKNKEKISPNKRQYPGELKGYPKQAQQFQESAEGLGYLVKQAFGWEKTPMYKSNLVAYRPGYEDNPSKPHLTLHTPSPYHPSPEFHARGQQKNNGFQSKIIFQTGKKTGDPYFSNKNGRFHAESSLGREFSSNSSRQLASNGLTIARDMATAPRRGWPPGEREKFLRNHLTGDKIRDRHWLKMMNETSGGTEGRRLIAELQLNK